MSNETNKYDFIVTGLPGTGSCFWSFALTESDICYCSHEREGPTHRPKAGFYGDSSSMHLEVPVKASRRLYVRRDVDECIQSHIRRYPTDRPEGIEEKMYELQDLLEGVKTKSEDVMFIDYEDQYSAETISDVFVHLIGRHPNKERINLLELIRIVKSE